MNDMIIADVMKACGHTDHVLAQASDAEVLTMAVQAALYFGNHHERAVMVMNRLAQRDRRDHQPAAAGWRAEFNRQFTGAGMKDSVARMFGKKWGICSVLVVSL
jgi:hypothetical protein